MYRTLLLYFLLLHLLGDYYLQTNTLAKNKETAYSYVVYHSLIYTAVLTAGAMLLGSFWIYIALLALAVSHFLIDSIKFHVVKTHPRLSAFTVHCVDQCLHVLLIILAVILLKAFSILPAFLPFLQSLRQYIPGDSHTLFQWLCLFAFIGKPSKLVVEQFIAQFKPAPETRTASQAAIREFSATPKSITIQLDVSVAEPPAANTSDDEKHKGAVIGILERIIIAVLLFAGQYAAIGLVLTAKSVARYEKLKDKEFAETYLLGTLFSTLLVIGAYLALFKLL